jgi:hypothetical protein
VNSPVARERATNVGSTGARQRLELERQRQENLAIRDARLRKNVLVALAVVTILIQGVPPIVGLTVRALGG